MSPNVSFFIKSCRNLTWPARFFASVAVTFWAGTLPGSGALADKPISWRLEKDANGVQVYVHDADAHSYRQVKAVARVATTVGGMVAVIKDDKASPRWMDRVVKFETIKTVSAQDWYTYAEIGIPWPFKNADIVTRNTLTQYEDGQVVITLQNEPTFVEKKKDKSRVLRAGGSWKITPCPGGVMIEYAFHAKPEGLALPAWLVNAITVQSLHRSAERLRKLAESDTYRGKS
ncbi:MAG: hypothetical protein MUD08_06020 [Cytophagales bacterium]|jgi:hypothetical protein|nr:hypothetical protein [Cytophagales bacterium]